MFEAFDGPAAVEWPEGILLTRTAMMAILRQLGRVWTWLFGAPAVGEPPAEPTDWCLVGNVVEAHAFGESKEIRRGSKHFTPGTKVYCLPPQWGDGYE